MEKYNSSTNSDDSDFCSDFLSTYFGLSNQIITAVNSLNILTCVLNSILAIFAIVGNSIVISAVLSTPSLRTPSNFILCSVFLADLLTGLIVQPAYVVMKIGGFISRGDIYCIGVIIYVGGGTTFSGNSFVSLTFLSVDKWLSLYFHLRYRELFTTKTALSTAAFSWLICFAGAGIILAQQRKAFIIMGILCFAILFPANILTYGSILKIAKHHKKMMHIQLQATEANSARHTEGDTPSDNVREFKKLEKSTTFVFVLYTLFLLCFAPMVVVFVIIYVAESLTGTLNIPINIATTLCFINSSLNPVIYLWKFKEIRLAAKRIITRNYTTRVLPLSR